MEKQKFQMDNNEIEMVRAEADSPYMDYLVKKLSSRKEENAPYLFDKSELRSFINLMPQAIYESVKPYSKLDELLYEIEEYLIDSDSVAAEEALIFQAEAF